jgi:hypothetical protein
LVKSVGVSFGAVFLVTACETSSLRKSATDAADSLTTGTIELTLGASGDSGFAAVTSVTLDSTGRIVVAEALRPMIHVYSSSGVPLFRFGRKGRGPGEFERPNQLAFDREGKLWVADGNIERFNRFELTSDTARYLSQISFEGDGPCCTGLSFDVAGNVIDIGLSPNQPGKGAPVLAWLHRDADGKVVRAVDIPNAPVGTADAIAVDTEGSRWFFYPVFGPRWLNAHAANGDWATTLTTRYEVTWYDDSGKVVTTIARSDAGDPLNDADRRWAHEANSREIHGRGMDTTKVRLPVPDRLPPINSIFFDALGRLWVQRTLHRGEPNRADVYTRDGKLVDRTTWPEDVSLKNGYIGRDVAFGIMTSDTLDGPRVVRLRFKRQR